MDFKYVIIKSQQRQSNTINLSILDFKLAVRETDKLNARPINLSILDFKFRETTGTPEKIIHYKSIHIGF